VAGIVAPPGKGEKAVLDELVVALLGGISTKPHLHRKHTDFFYVLEGDFSVAGEPIGPGDIGYAPPGSVHWFEAPEATFLNVHAPGAQWRQRSLAVRAGRTIDDETADSFDAPEGAVPERVIVAASEGEPLTDDERTIRIKVARPELCLFEFDAKPGYTGPGPHVHREHVDAFYVLEGALEFELDGERTRADEGMFVAATPGVVHTFKNATAGRARFLNLHAPGMRFDEYMRRQNAGEDGRRFRESFDVYEVEVT
jgi:quercetin dioxygenase-like cupin family protein